MLITEFIDKVKENLDVNGSCSVPMIKIGVDHPVIMAFEYTASSAQKDQIEFTTYHITAVYTSDGENINCRFPEIYEDCDEFDPILSINPVRFSRRAEDDVIREYCTKLQDVLDLYRSDRLETVLPRLTEISNEVFKYEIWELYVQVCPEFFDLIKYKRQ